MLLELPKLSDFREIQKHKVYLKWVYMENYVEFGTISGKNPSTILLLLCSEKKLSKAITRKHEVQQSSESYMHSWQKTGNIVTGGEYKWSMMMLRVLFGSSEG